MVNRNRKGSRGEREAAAVLTELTGLTWERRLGEGSSKDMGDLICVDRDIYCVQVKNLASPTTAFAQGRMKLYRQARNLAKWNNVEVYPWCMFKFRGGWFCGLKPDSLPPEALRFSRWTTQLFEAAEQGAMVVVGDWAAMNVSKAANHLMHSPAVSVKP